MKHFYLTIVFLVLANIVYAQSTNAYHDADALFYCGEVVWDMTFEANQPFTGLEAKHKPTGLSDDEFNAWKEKLKKTRQQTYSIRALFRGDKLRFECISDPGDVLPVECNRVIAFNGVSITFVDHILKNVIREAWDKPYRQSHFTDFYYPPRACGYGYSEVIKLIREVKDINQSSPTLETKVDENSQAITIEGQFNSGKVALAELIPDFDYGQVFSTIKYIEPIQRNRIEIRNEQFTEYNAMIVFPKETVISRYHGGDLKDLSNATMIDRITLKTVYARFNHLESIGDEAFNPIIPNNYTDLGDMRYNRFKKQTHSE